ncbi:MAG: methyltransferase [Bacteriovoracaceae bacterium]
MRSPIIKYHTRILQRRLDKLLFVLEVIRDLDEAIDQVCEALTEEEQKDPFAEDLCPYFGVLWPAAEALSVFLSQNSELVKGKKVLELGCGLGYPSLVAKKLGAEVLATDFHPQVEEFFLRNCRHSNLKCDYKRLNWREGTDEIGLFDVVMGSDVLYESKHPKEVVQGLLRFVKPGGHILLSDPGRNYLQQFINAMNADGHQENMSTIEVDKKEIFIFRFDI